MLNNADIQDAIVTKLKGSTSLVALLTSLGSGMDEIREAFWQGTDMKYPMIRVQLHAQTPNVNTNCDQSVVTYALNCFTQDSSSLNCDTISFEVAKVFHKHNFLASGISFVSCRVISIGKAERIDERTWASRVEVSSIVH